MKSSRAMRIEKEKGAFVSESALHIMAVSRILFPEFLRGDDHLSRPNFSERPIPQLRDRDATNPRINPESFRGVRTGCPPSVLSCTAWGFSCLANYSASGELLPRLFNLACTSFKEPAVSFL